MGKLFEQEVHFLVLVYSKTNNRQRTLGGKLRLPCSPHVQLKNESFSMPERKPKKVGKTLKLVVFVTVTDQETIRSFYLTVHC